MYTKDQFKLTDENGEEKTYTIVLSFDNDETRETYIVYTDQAVDENGAVQLYALKYDSDLEIPKFKNIETETEWKIIEIVVKKLKEDALFS